MMNNLVVYHFTDTARLPWIIESAELRPGANRIGGYPNDLLWATTSGAGDKTSAAFGTAAREVWRAGLSQLIRFTLRRDDFLGWRDAVECDANWTNDHIIGLEIGAKALGEPNTCKWRARHQPLPLSAVVAVDAKSYGSGRWTPIEATPDFCMVLDRTRRAFVIADQAYGATRDGNSYSCLTRQPVTRLSRKAQS
jgi:hypothetical protein